MIEKKWLSVSGVAKHLGISKVTVYRLLKTKKIPSYRLGKLHRFSIQEIDQWATKGSLKNKAFPKGQTQVFPLQASADRTDLPDLPLREIARFLWLFELQLDMKVEGKKVLLSLKPL
jgi:excisionase family DNA binding protein